MDIKDIPVRIVGPGSQSVGEDGQEMSFIDMPGDMATYEDPHIPEPDAVRHLVGAREAMLWLRHALANYRPESESQLANLDALDEENRELVNQILGEGEVSISYNGSVTARSQEAVMAGIWRTLYFADDGTVCHDILEVADAPHIVRLPDGRERTLDAGAGDVPPEFNNALAILVELQTHCAEFEKSGESNTINLTLLPLSGTDIEFIDTRLGRGPIDTLSRAYGKCQVTSTLIPNVWWVRFYNSMGTLILNTLEITDMPAVLCAAPEDLQDSAERLDSILTPYWSDVV